MFYKIKVWSVEDNTQSKSFYIKDTYPEGFIDANVLAKFYKRATPYQVRVVALPKHVTSLKKKFKVWNDMELERYLRTLKFYTIKDRKEDSYERIATFYKVKPFDIENDFFQGRWYSFFKRPAYTCKDLLLTLIETFKYGPVVHLSKYNDPFVLGKLTFSSDGFGYWHLNILVGTETIQVKEELYM